MASRPVMVRCAQCSTMSLPADSPHKGHKGAISRTLTEAALAGVPARLRGSPGDLKTHFDEITQRPLVIGGRATAA